MTGPLTDGTTGAADEISRAEGGQTIVELLGRLTSQGAHLAQEQVALVQAEVREGLSDIRQVIAAHAFAGMFGLAGLVVTVTGVGWLLGDALENVPVGILIAGGGTLIVAAILYAGARRKLKTTDLKPARSIRTLEDTPAILSGAPASENNNLKGAPHDRNA
jgi:hypothetical protein